MAKAGHFYGTVLGLSKVERSLKYPGAWYQVGEHQIHLIATPSVPATRQDSDKWGRNPHFALAVTDIDAAKQQLIAHNCPFHMSASGRTALFTQDPNNNIIESQL